MNRGGWLVRILALVLGVWALAMLVKTAGVDELTAQLERTLPALVWLALLEPARLASEIVATASQLGRYVKPLGARALVRGHLLSYATNTLAPAGRLTGEIIKAASYAPMLGKPIAAALAVRIQAASMLAGGAMSAICGAAAFVASAPAWLSVGLGVHTAVAIGAAVALLAVDRAAPAQTTANKLQLSLSALKTGMDALPRSIARPTAWLLLGRVIQVAEMVVLLAILGRVPKLGDSLVMEGIFMIGTAAGDLIPGQLGATDAAFSLGATSFAVSVSQGLAIAAAIHVAQLAMASICSLTALAPVVKPARRKSLPLPVRSQGAE